jgi:predicted ATPase
MSGPKIIKPIDYDMVKVKQGIEYCGKHLYDQFKIDKHNEGVIESIIRYFHRDPEFESEPGRLLSKGILMVGPIGVGKTMLLQAFSLYNTSCRLTNFKIIPTREIARIFTQQGYSGIEQFSVESFRDGASRRDGIAYCLDDLGLEDVGTKHYGNNANVIAEVLLDRYDLRLLTHATTNLTPKELAQVYGDRVRSRMTEMFNDILLMGEDRRR